MNILSDNTDAMNNTTRFSNDGLGRNTQTNYPGGSATNNSYTYQNILYDYFGANYTGYIEFLKYTDEMNHNFEKYFDAVGNLLKEVKYADEDPTGRAATVRMETDYYYDSLYRLIKVKTPENKYIYYSYDGYGRQSQRITPDAGQTEYFYDNNNNLTYTQDANQRNEDQDLHTFRVYDGVNRLTGVGDAIIRFEMINDINSTQYQSDSPVNYLTVNVYDTLSSSVVSDLFTPPSDYYTNVNNFTKGNLAATAYRTRNTDNWSFKYYRYDERSRVIKMWNIIDGLDGKEIRYQYNSQDQITEINFGYEADYKRYSYYYDYAGRLGTLNFANTDPAIDKSAIDYNFTTYSYNPNSLISFQFFKASELQNQYEYNSRNWITSMNSLQGLFGFTNTYFSNGNVNTQLLFGTYKDNFPQNNYNLYYNFSYDNSNRLLEAVNTNQGDMSFSVLNTYDKDGNITTLKRYGDNNVITDDFNYQYYSGTNKLSKVSGAIDQYSYDLNGNVTRDTINYNYNIQYDHRNLITQFYHTDRDAVSRPYTYATRYYYDESGGRVRKLEYFNTQTNPPLITDWTNPGNGWTLFNNEFYVKGADGKDLATYQGSELEDWYVWGNDLTGKIRKDKPYYYYKDHLGSVRAIVNEDAQIVAAFDYDAWGYPLEGREYNADSLKFKYTGKELDKESLYDYFGARYYDSRIGRWGQVEPLLDKYLSLTPYNYSVDNPLRVIDPNGADPFEIIVRTYIPFDVIFPGFKGDSRGADPNATSYRTEQRITVETDRSISSTIIQSYKTSLSPSMSMNPIGNNPPYLVGMGEGEFSAIASYSSDVNEGNNASVDFTGEANVGIIPSALAPAINYTFGITILPQKDGTVKVSLNGAHDGFPGYEIYIKDKTGKVTSVYNPPEPTNSLFGPLRLYPPKDIEVNSQIIIP